MKLSPSQEITFTRFNQEQKEEVEGAIITEQPVTMFVNGEHWVTFLCTPTDIEALTVGFLFTEQIINSKEDVREVSIHPDGCMVDVYLSKKVKKPESWRLTSGCGGGVVSEKTEILPPPKDPGKITVYAIQTASAALFEHQGLYQQTRGVHASGLFDGENPVIVCEDIGRHNTVDKVAGKMLMEGLTASQPILVSSGRVSSEMLYKASIMGIAVVITRTSPTSLSISLAEESNITLIGYSRGRQFNVYSHPERVVFSLMGG